jgi:C4-dicarboxylate-specific signal transduction histidine kinase
MPRQRHVSKCLSLLYEVKQPLAAITANGSAVLRWLANTTPDLGEARAALERMVDAARHAGEVIDAIRSMFRKSDDERLALKPNVVIEEVLALMHVDLQRRGISIETRLRPGLPEIEANRVELQQVFLNLLVNARQCR